MYEKPKLNRVGDAENVILGLLAFGPDLDNTYVDSQDEFALDSEDLNRS
jgi:hypothetical protein